MEQQATPGPYYGQYSFPLPARVVKTLLGNWDRGDWYSIRQAVYAPIESRNYFGNVWATWLRDLLIDFGAVVAILFCAAAGAFMAWARNRHEMTGALHYHYFEVLACFSLGFGAFTSFLFDPFLAIPFFMAFVVMAFVRLSWPAGRQARLRAAPSGASREPAKPILPASLALQRQPNAARPVGRRHLSGTGSTAPCAATPSRPKALLRIREGSEVRWGSSGVSAGGWSKPWSSSSSNSLVLSAGAGTDSKTWASAPPK